MGESNGGCARTTYNPDGMQIWSMDWSWFLPRKATLSPAPRKGASPLLKGRVRPPTTVGEDILTSTKM